MVPTDLRYQESHEWARKDGDIVTIGITAFAVEHLRDLTYLALPEVGASVTRGERFGEIESVKAVSDLMAPVSGEVVEIHEALTDEIQQVADDPFGEGWMIRVRMADDGEWNQLLDEAAYQQHIAAEAE